MPGAFCLELGEERSKSPQTVVEGVLSCLWTDQSLTDTNAECAFSYASDESCGYAAAGRGIAIEGVNAKPNS